MEPLPWYRVAAPLAAVAALALFAVFTRNPRLRAALLGSLLMATYGMTLDQISARLCPEYFTVLHQPIRGLTNPTLLGLAWGFLGAAGGGVAMGYAAGVAATIGRRPPMTVRELVVPMLVLLAGVAVVTSICGASAYRHAEFFSIRLDPAMDPKVPPERHRALFAVACYHLAAYASAIIGSVVLCVWIVHERGRKGQTICARDGTEHA